MSCLVLADVAYAFPDDTPLVAGLDLVVGTRAWPAGARSCASAWSPTARGTCPPEFQSGVSYVDTRD